MPLGRRLLRRILNRFVRAGAMRIDVLFDSRAARGGLLTGWGFSALVGGKILFDAGSQPEAVMTNLSVLGKNLSDIQTAVLSHAHQDHTEGFWRVLEKRPGLKVFVCPDFPADLLHRIRLLGALPVAVRPWMEIAEDIFTTGALPGRYQGRPMPEQSLILRGADTIAVLTGCAHFGAEKIARLACEKFPEKKLGLVLGGFHLKNRTDAEISAVCDAFEALGAMKIAPAHCTGSPAVRELRRRLGPAACPDVSAGCAFEA